jgi:hypothetical protein
MPQGTLSSGSSKTRVLRPSNGTTNHSSRWRERVRPFSLRRLGRTRPAQRSFRESDSTRCATHASVGGRVGPGTWRGRNTARVDARSTSRVFRPYKRTTREGDRRAALSISRSVSRGEPNGPHSLLRRFTRSRRSVARFSEVPRVDLRWRERHVGRADLAPLRSACCTICGTGKRCAGSSRVAHPVRARATYLGYRPAAPALAPPVVSTISPLHALPTAPPRVPILVALPAAVGALLVAAPARARPTPAT